MKCSELLSLLRSKGIDLWVEGDKLRYSAPAGAVTAEVAADLAKHKGEIVQLLLAQGAISPASRDQPLPLSFAQERLWFLDQLEPGSTVFNMPGAFRLKGRLNVSALTRSLDEIVRRHEALRTVFTSNGGSPQQVVAPDVTLPLAVIDLDDWAESDREHEAHRLAAEEARQPFDLSQGPLVRATLLRLHQEEHFLLLNMHHIVSDGWSMGVFFRELSVLYEAYSSGKPSPLPELTIQYADYALWQRKWLQGEALETQLSYWKKQLEDMTALQMPTDRPRPAAQSFRGARESLVLSEELTERLKVLSRKEGATLFMTSLAAFEALLSRLTGQDDIAVGSPIAGRNRAEVEGLIGFFINTLVLRTDLSDSPTFRELLARVRGTCLDAYAHQDVPFEKLLEELRPERDLSRTPFFQVFFNMVNIGERSPELSGVRIETLSPVEVESKFDLTIYARERHGTLQFNWVYNAGLFDRDRMREMAEQYENLLSQIVGHPAESIYSYSLLTESARKLLPDPRASLASDWAGSVHERFSRQARSLPDQPAITDPCDSWTYKELNSRSNQLAHHLIRSGIEHQDIVAIYAHRSASLAWALLGVIKAGAAFLILDPAYPPARLAQYVRASKPKGFISLTAGAVVAKELESLLELTVRCRVALPRLADLRLADFLESYSTEDPDLATGPDDLAYVAFTSGSTGEPKGVLGRHGPLSHFLPWQAEKFALEPSDRFSLLSGLSHDPLQREIFTALWVGATICVPEPDVTGTGGEMADWMARQRVTFAHLTPALGRLLTDGASPQTELPSLRYAFFVGDKLHWADVDRLHRLAPQVACVNYYGSTETQRAVSYYEVAARAKTIHAQAAVPVGHGMPNVQLLILTKAGQLAGRGEVGEIYLRSPHLAKGYLGDASLTEARFITNPFTREATDRLYRTGDLGRYLQDGALEVLGRSDRQVNIRGFRVELGEIEAALNQHPAVRENAVLAREDVPGEKRLVAYFVPCEGAAAAAGDLRSFLKQRLPDHMAPSAFVLLKTLPLTPNGKVDHRALPAPDPTRPDVENTFVAPRTPNEEILAGIWADVLKLDRVGIHENFFHLGGHSLKATQLISRVREAFQADLPLRALFESPTVAELVERAEEARRAKQHVQAFPLFPVPRDSGLPLSFAQERLWFLNQLEPGSTVYNMPGALRLRGPLDLSALERSLNEIVRRHEALRTAFKSVQGSPEQVIASTLTMPLPVIDLREFTDSERDNEANRLAAEEARRPFDLSQGPLFRATLLRSREQEHLLLWNMHHIVSDGWSMTIFSRELSVLYQAFSEGTPPSLPDLPVQYADYAVWQRKWLQGEVLETQLSYWEKQLENVSTLQLPTDRPRHALQSFRGARLSLRLSKELTDRLKALSRTQGVTLFMTLLAGFQALLHRLTGQDDIAVGSPIAGRNRTEIEGLIGFFVNLLVLRTDVPGSVTFRELLARVREACLGAYAHQDLPFEKLVEELQPQRDLSRSPLVQVLFNMHNLPNSRMEMNEVTIERAYLFEPPSKFDLTLYAPERDGAIELLAVYNTDLFARSRIVAMLDQLKHLLDQATAKPEERIDRFSLVTSAAKAVLPDPTSALDGTWKGAMQALFSKQARRRPERLAVVDPHGSWSYGELDDRSNQLARYLRASGIQPQDVVAIYAHRSAPLVWGLLGILKAGAAFLILDPAHPPSRLIDCLRLAKPRGWLQMQSAGALPEPLEEFLGTLTCSRLVLPRDGSSQGPWAGYTTDDPEVSVAPDDPAYVAFTSGSTGEPKGILCRHGPVSHFLPWLAETFGLSETDRFSVLSGLSFNPLHREIFTPLWLGATLCIPDPEEIAPGELAEWMGKQGITVAHLTPAMGQILNHAADGTLLGSLRYAFFAGDVLRKRDVGALRKLAPLVSVVNFYGATETQRAVGHFIVPKAAGKVHDEHRREHQLRDIIPLGRGIQDVQLLVLNAAQELAGVGELGEIYFRSPHLAKGYLGDDSPTVERFIINPFTAEPFDRLFKTCELGRYLPDGNVEFAGRSDHQVKIRGFRVEPDEIEAVLNRHPGVRQGVVVALEDERGDKRLVGYIVPATEPSPTITELRSFLRAKLPDYMVPSAFVSLNALPLTPNGKLDRRALPAPDHSRPELEQSFVAPRTPTEEALAKIWAEVLKLEQVGIHDNFFELGGHSLLATQVLSRIHDILNGDLPLRALFENPTVSRLAVQITRIQSSKNGAEELGEILADLESLSDEEAEALVLRDRRD